MKFLESILLVPVLLAFVAGANVVSDSDVQTRSSLEAGSILPYLAMGVLFAFIASGLFFLAKEIRREEKEKNKKEDGS